MQDYKCLCTAVTMCATVVDQKCDFYILTSVALKSRSTRGESVSWSAHIWCTYDANSVT